VGVTLIVPRELFNLKIDVELEVELQILLGVLRSRVVYAL
jgi:hypothetical protein